MLSSAEPAAAGSSSDFAALLLDRVTIRARSLIVTVWGDTVAAHGRPIWLGSLIRLLADFGLNERVVRTSIFRLQKDSWLSGYQVGRRSFYELAPSGRRRSAAADERIYRAGPRPWNGEWLVLILGPGSAEVRERLRRELIWMGFGTPAPGVFTHPDANWPEVRSLLDDYGVAEDTAVFHSTGDLMSSLEPVRRMVAGAWDHDALAVAYRDFIQLFQPLLDALAAGMPLAERDAFIIRTLLIHEFRRVTLRDPMLPESLMSRDWAGHTARRLSARLYQAVHVAATRHARNVLETEEGGLPPPLPAYYDRFGGLFDGGEEGRTTNGGGSE